MHLSRKDQVSNISLGGLGVMPAPKRRREMGAGASITSLSTFRVTIALELNLTFFEKKNSLICKEKLTDQNKLISTLMK
jgi:hypothetical protein